MEYILRECIIEGCSEIALSSGKFCCAHSIENRQKKRDEGAWRKRLKKQEERKKWLESDEGVMWLRREEEIEKERVQARVKVMSRREKIQKERREEKIKRRVEKAKKLEEYRQRQDEKKKLAKLRAQVAMQKRRENQIKRIEKLYGKPIKEIQLPGETIEELLLAEKQVRKLKYER